MFLHTSSCGIGLGLGVRGFGFRKLRDYLGSHNIEERQGRDS